MKATVIAPTAAWHASRRMEIMAKGRQCAQEGCSTRLSVYNPTAYCSIHNNPRKADRRLFKLEDDRTSTEEA